jgi:hypothetical protein
VAAVSAEPPQPATTPPISASIAIAAPVRRARPAEHALRERGDFGFIVGTSTNSVLLINFLLILEEFKS